MSGIRGTWAVAAALVCGCGSAVSEQAASVCMPGSTVACYTGPAGTESVGSCVAGLATCHAEGSGFGPCVGEVLPAPDLCVTPIDEDCDGADPSCPPVQPWSRRFGGAMFEEAYGLAVDAAGSSVLTGRFEGPADFGGPPLMGDGMYVLKLDTAGDPIWSRSYSASFAYGYGVAVDAAGNSLHTGFFGGTIDFGNGPLTGTGWVGFVAKLDPAANPLFSHALLEPDGLDFELELIQGVAVDPAGNVVIGGWFQGAAMFGGTTYTSTASTSGFVAKLDAAGNDVWAKVIGGESAYVKCRGVAVDGEGNVLVTGHADGTVDFGAGSTTGGSAFVVKLSAAGTPLWSYRFPDSSWGDSVATDSAGNVVVSRSLPSKPAPDPSPPERFVAKLDAGGKVLWDRSFGASGYEHNTLVAVDPTGAILVTGDFDGTLDFGAGPLASNFSKDVFVAKLDPGGEPIWSKRFGGVYDDAGTGIAADASGNVLVTGDFMGEIDFGDGPLVSELRDIFVAKLPP